MSKKILFITVVDMYDKNGNGGVKGSQRNYNLLCNIFGEENVTLATFPRNEYTIPPKDAIVLQRTQNNFQHLVAALFGCKVYFPWKENEIHKFINSLDIDILFVDSSMLGRITRLEGNYKTIVFFHNVEAKYALNKVKNEGIWFWPSYYASRKNEEWAMKYADSVVCLNERDKAELYDLYGRTTDFILPVTMDDAYDDEQAMLVERRKRLLFVGAYMPQNIASIEWFLENVIKEIPDIELDIVGKGFEEKRIEYEKISNVKVIGTVDDLGKYYYSHNIVVLPIQYGAGMKIKTVEAMMYGNTIIASNEALEGYSVEGVEGIHRCNTPEEYISAIRLEMGFEGFHSSVRETYIKKYTTTVVEAKFKEFIEKV